MAFLEKVLFRHPSEVKRNGVHCKEPVLSLPQLSAGPQKGLLEKALGIFGDQALLFGLGGHFLNAGVVDVAGCEAVAQILLDPGHIVFVHLDVYVLEDFFNAPGIGCGLHHQLGEVPVVEDLSQDVENLVAAQGIPDLPKLFKELGEDPSFAGILCHQVEDRDLLGLAIPVDTAHPLFQAVGVPGDVVVDHEVAKLEVDPFACRFGGHQDLGFGLEDPFGPDPVFQTHAPVDDIGLVSPLFYPVFQIVEGIPGFRKDEEFSVLRALVFLGELMKGLSKFLQLDLLFPFDDGPRSFDEVGEGCDLPLQLFPVFGNTEGLPDLFLFPPVLLAQVLHGVEIEGILLRLFGFKGAFQQLFEPPLSALQGFEQGISA
jgi:hypothetical protein